MQSDKASLNSPSLEALETEAISYAVERQVRLDCGLLEVGRFEWMSPIDVEVQCRDDRIACNLALSPRPAASRLVDLDGDAAGAVEGLDRVIMLEPGRRYRLSMPAGKVRALYCEISKSALEALLQEPVDLASHDWRSGWQSPSSSRAQVIEQLLNRMYREMREDDFASEIALTGYAQALCVELARGLRKAKTDSKAPRNGGLAPWRMRILLERVQSHAPAPRLAELAELTGLTVRQLARAFKEETGKPLGGFVMDVTAERGATLLAQTCRPIAQIAKELGFSSSTSFSYSFRRTKGVLPREFRRRLNAASVA